jgi:hypothetical protein
VEDAHRELAALPEPLAYVEYKIAFMAPADLWFSTDALVIYCATNEEIYESAT